MIKKLSRSKASVDNDVLELFNLKAQIKLLQERETELKDRISDYVTKHVTPDTKSTFTYFVNSPTGKRILFQKRARKSVSLNEDVALTILRKKKLDDAIICVEKIADEVTDDQLLDALLDSGYTEYVDVKDTVDELALEELVKNGKITTEEFEKMCSIVINYATFCIEEKEEEEEEIL